MWSIALAKLYIISMIWPVLRKPPERSFLLGDIGFVFLYPDLMVGFLNFKNYAKVFL